MLIKHTWSLIATLRSSPLPSERNWSHPSKIFDADCTISYVLNSRVTYPNLATFPQDVQKWLAINQLKSKLCYTNPFPNASVPNEQRSSSCGLIAAKIPQTPFLNSKVTEPIFNTFLHDVEALVPLLMHTFTEQYFIAFQNVRAKSESSQFRRPCQKSPKLIGYYSNVPIATA